MYCIKEISGPRNCGQLGSIAMVKSARPDKTFRGLALLPSSVDWFGWSKYSIDILNATLSGTFSGSV
jgi:hypothetical protein